MAVISSKEYARIESVLLRGPIGNARKQEVPKHNYERKIGKKTNQLEEERKCRSYP
jgi:transcriptional/translational regulatory protein YebC/TACO1